VRIVSEVKKIEFVEEAGFLVSRYIRPEMFLSYDDDDLVARNTTGYPIFLSLSLYLSFFPSFSSAPIRFLVVPYTYNVRLSLGAYDDLRVCVTKRSEPSNRLARRSRAVAKKPALNTLFISFLFLFFPYFFLLFFFCLFFFFYICLFISRENSIPLSYFSFVLLLQNF
jgi:hypothetical protein